MRTRSMTPKSQKMNNDESVPFDGEEVLEHVLHTSDKGL